jgi:hypothetical protein
MPPYINPPAIKPAILSDRLAFYIKYPCIMVIISRLRVKTVATLSPESNNNNPPTQLERLHQHMASRHRQGSYLKRHAAIQSVPKWRDIHTYTRSSRRSFQATLFTHTITINISHTSDNPLNTHIYGIYAGSPSITPDNELTLDCCKHSSVIFTFWDYQLTQLPRSNAGTHCQSMNTIIIISYF